MTRLANAVTVLGLLALAPFALAQQYPVKPVRLIVPFTPGGGTDFVTRTVVARVFEKSGHQILVDNRPGAAGNLGTALGAKAPPDGYTLTIAYMGTLAIGPWLYKDLGYHPLQDFAYVTQLISVPLVVVAHPSLPVKNLKELAALAKSQPGKLSYASAGDTSQMTGELFKQMSGTHIVQVPYKGAGPATTDLIGGHIPLAFLGVAATTEQIKSGRIRGLAVTGPTRLPSLPDVASAPESGFKDLDVNDWYGVAVPAGTPRETVARLNAEFVRALQSSDVKEKLNRAGFDTAPKTPEEFTAYVRAEYERWGKVVKQAGVKAQ